MNHYNLLGSGGIKPFAQRKVVLKNLLLLLSSVIMTFSIVSGANFVLGTLLPFEIPYWVALCAGVAVAVIVDLVQQASVIQLAVDYFKDKTVEPFTLGIAIAFVAVSAYISVQGTELKHLSKQLDIIEADTTAKALAGVISVSAMEPKKVVKTEKMSWAEHAREIESAKLKQASVAANQEAAKVAGKIVEKEQVSVAKKQSVIQQRFSMNKWTMVVLQFLFIVSTLGVGYFQCLTESDEHTNRKRPARPMPYPTRSGGSLLDDDMQADDDDDDDDDDNFPRQRKGILNRVVIEGFHRPNSFPEPIHSTEENVSRLDFNPNTERKCISCGNVYSVGHARQKFCSVTCKNKFHNSKK